LKLLAILFVDRTNSSWTWNGMNIFPGCISTSYLQVSSRRPNPCCQLAAQLPISVRNNGVEWPRLAGYS
jgi:hypothetical protein